MVLEIPGALFGQSDVRETETNPSGSNIIKSIQYGVITLSDLDLTEAVSIESVVKANSMLLFLGNTGETEYGQPENAQCYLEFTTGTSITATRGKGDADGETITVRFCVVEFNGNIVKSNQVGTISMPDATNTATITSVDVTKAALLYCGNSVSAGGDGDSFVNLTLTNATTVSADRFAGTGTAVVSYQVVEFY